MNDNFPEQVKRALASRVGNICSNPDCRALTSGPQDDPTKSVNLGVAAHITAASPGGPRYDAGLLAEERSGAPNGVWLCQNCAKLIDNDPLQFSVELLKAWKTIAEDNARKRLGKTAGPGIAKDSSEARTAEIKIIPDSGGRYILHPLSSIPHGDFNGMFLDFRLMIENTGRRNSTINDFQVDILELNQTFPGLAPLEGRHGVQGRHCQHGLQPDAILSNTRLIRVEAESTTNHGALLFFIPGMTTKDFFGAGLEMQGDEKKFGTLRCRLTVRDTANSSAVADFELFEA